MEMVLCVANLYKTFDIEVVNEAADMATFDTFNGRPHKANLSVRIRAR